MHDVKVYNLFSMFLVVFQNIIPEKYIVTYLAWRMALRQRASVRTIAKSLPRGLLYLSWQVLQKIGNKLTLWLLIRTNFSLESYKCQKQFSPSVIHWSTIHLYNAKLFEKKISKPVFNLKIFKHVLTVFIINFVKPVFETGKAFFILKNKKLFLRTITKLGRQKCYPRRLDWSLFSKHKNREQEMETCCCFQKHVLEVVFEIRRAENYFYFYK